MKKSIVVCLFSLASVGVWAQAEKSDVINSKDKQQRVKPLIVINGLKMNHLDSINILALINPQIITSIEVLKGDQAIEKYGIEGEQGATLINTSSRTQFEPLYIVDGKEVDNLNHLNPSDIASMEVIKDRDKIGKYGDNAQGGVILVKMKNYYSNTKE